MWHSLRKVAVSPRHILFWLLIFLAAPLAETLAVQEAATPEAAAQQQTTPPEENTPAEQESYLTWIVHTSGWIGGVLLVMSFFLVARVIECFMEFRAAVVTPSDLIEEWEQLLKNRDVQGLYNSAKESDSQLGNLVATGLAAISGGLSEAREAIDRMGETLTVHMEKRISMLAVLGSLGPLIGLLGTLKGMISSFSVIARSETQMKASEVAGGISEALLITFEGVALSVPAIFFYAYFKNQISTLSLDAMNRADALMRRIYSSRSVPTAAAGSTKV